MSKAKKPKPMSTAADTPKQSDRHKEKRRTVNLSPRTHRLLSKLAEIGKRPLQWEFDRLVLEAARAAGIEDVGEEQDN